MPAPRDRLAKAFVDSAFEFHRRRLWKELPADAVFLVRVPGEDSPLAANVIGQGGQDRGLGLARGEGAFRRMAGMYLEGGNAEDFTEAAELLSVVFEPWGTLPEEFRKLLYDAKVQARRERIVPVAFHRRPYEQARSPGRSELRTLQWVVDGILAAHDAGELHPSKVPTLDQRRVLELEVSGKPRNPAVTARIIAWPEDVDAFDAAPLVGLPEDLQGLPQLEGRWLVARVPMSAEIRGDVRALFGIFVAEESEGLVLQNDVAAGDDLTPVAEVLSNACLTQRGLPRAVVFDSPRLHQALAPALAGLGVDAVLDEDCEALLELSEELASVGEALLGETRGEPPTLQYWKAVDRQVSSAIFEEIVSKDRMSSRALARYFGSAEVGEELLAQLGQYSVFGALAEWLAADYRATKRSKTMIEKLLVKRSLDPAERVLLEARRDAVLSIFRVVSCEPGATMEVEDVLSGERTTIHEKSMSECGLEGSFVPLRLLRVEEWTFPAIAGPPLVALDVESALQAIRAQGAELTPEGLRRDAHFVGRLWSWMVERAGRPGVLQNTDGDPLEYQTATFHVADPPRLERALDKRSDLDFDDQEGCWVWLSENAGETLGRTVMGRLELLDDRLVLEVNSERRLARAREWLEGLAGVRFERSTVHGLEPAERPLDDRLPDAPAEPPSAEDVELLERTVSELYRRWLDQRVPLLDDLTPREACATDEGRRTVARLVATMPEIQTPNGPIPVPRGELLRELGISKRG